MPLSRKFVNFLLCPEDNCASSFETADELSLHIASGEYTIPKLFSDIDKAKNTFAKRMTSITKKKNYFNNNSFETVTASNYNEIYSSLISQGGALKPKRKFLRLNQNQKEFLQDCFYLGDKTGNKLTAHNECCENGEKSNTRWRENVLPRKTFDTGTNDVFFQQNVKKN